MCKILYKYFLITATCFGACGGLYLLCLTEWLWPYPMEDERDNLDQKWDYRYVLIYSGLCGFIIFTPGIVIVIRAKPKELQYYGIFLIIPFVATLVCLILQIWNKINKYKAFELDATDWYLFGVVLGLLATVVNLFLFVYEINTYGGHHLISTAKFSEENAV